MRTRTVSPFCGLHVGGAQGSRLAPSCGLTWLGWAVSLSAESLSAWPPVLLEAEWGSWGHSGSGGGHVQGQGNPSSWGALHVVAQGLRDREEG